MITCRLLKATLKSRRSPRLVTTPVLWPGIARDAVSVELGAVTRSRGIARRPASDGVEKTCFNSIKVNIPMMTTQVKLFLPRNFAIVLRKSKTTCSGRPARWSHISTFMQWYAIEYRGRTGSCVFTNRSQGTVPLQCARRALLHDRSSTSATTTRRRDTSRPCM